MAKSQLGLAHFSNLLALAVIALVFLLLLSVLSAAFTPRAWLQNPRIAEFCIGKRMTASEAGPRVWLAAPPHKANTTLEHNASGALCGLLPWFSGKRGFWYLNAQP